MSALTILTDALRAIPAPVRQGLLVVWALLVVAAGALRIADIDTGPLEPILLYVGGYLGAQSAANVHPDGKVEPLMLAADTGLAALTLHLRCPVRTCSETFDIPMNGDAYGVITIGDNGCAEITRGSAPGVDEHLAAHWADGTAGAELNAQIDAWSTRRRAPTP